MDEEIYAQLAERLGAGLPSVLATIVRTKGSTPQQAGAKAIFTPEGGIVGTIGGGCLEHEARRRALDCFRDGRGAMLEVDLTGDFDQQTGLICGGLAHILLEVPEPAQADLFARAEALRAAGLPCAVAAALDRPGARALASDNGERLGEPELADIAAEALRQRAPGLREVSGQTVFVDLVLPRPRLWIAGAGHVGRALARHASAVGFEVIVVDDRPDLNCAEAIPWADAHRVGDIAAELAAPSYGPDDYVVVVTRGHQHDAVALSAVVRSAARYIGLIGSRRKIKLIREGLVGNGEADPEQLARVYAPIGLDIGAVTVDEIAVCITAELIAVRRGRLSSPAERPRLSRTPGSHPCAEQAT